MPETKTKKFDVLSPLKRDGELFQPGDPVSFKADEKDQIQPLIDAGTIGVPGSYKKSLLTLESLEEKNKKLVDEIAAVQKENANLKEQLSKIAKGNDDVGKAKGNDDGKGGGK